MSLAEDTRAALEASTKWMIAERDSLFACITDVEGNIPDDDDGQYLRELDKLIDANRAALARHEHGEPVPAADDPVRELLDAAKGVSAYEIGRMPPHRWYGLQAAIAKVYRLYSEEAACRR